MKVLGIIAVIIATTSYLFATNFTPNQVAGRNIQFKTLYKESYLQNSLI